MYQHRLRCLSCPSLAPSFSFGPDFPPSCGCMSSSLLQPSVLHVCRPLILCSSICPSISTGRYTGQCGSMNGCLNSSSFDVIFNSIKWVHKSIRGNVLEKSDKTNLPFQLRKNYIKALVKVWKRHWKRLCHSKNKIGSFSLMIVLI